MHIGLNCFTSRQCQAPNIAKVADPIQGMIVAINMYLQAYHMYRATSLNKPEVKRLDNKSSDALDTLQT